MVRAFDQIDPEWAWSPYKANDEQPWDARRVTHLLRRAGFGATPAQLEAALRKSPVDLVRELAGNDRRDESFQQEMDALAETMLATGNSNNLPVVWLYRMLDTPQPLVEKMTLFWHGHFASSADKVDDVRLMLRQNQLLRDHALGDFAELTRQISADPAMLLYLDSANNRKSHPNENYARELMELFCLGEGHYSERDVQEVARCFTGWEVRRRKFHFNRYQHDFGEKTILGQEGEFGGEDAVRVILRQPAAPQFVARKLFRFFVCDEPEPTDALLQPLADHFRRHDLRVGPLVERILTSQLFFSEWSIARKIRSPVDMLVGLLRSLQASTNVYDLVEGLQQLGQRLFFPPNVKGWDGGRTWINSSTLLGRANVIQRVLNNDNTRFAGGTLADFFEDQQLSKPAEQVDWLAEMLLCVPLPAELRQELVELTRTGTADEPDRRLLEMVYILSSLPEFQLG